jgi:putative PEP-CTERM system TPR-repeat lipoprotein
MLHLVNVRYVLLAAALLSAGCSFSPKQREARFIELGKKEMAKQDYARAALRFRSAIQVAPGDAEPYYQLGLAQLAAGYRDLAIASFRKATALNPKYAQAQLKLATLLSMTSDRAAVQDAHQRAWAIASAFPGNVEALNTLALTDLRLGRPDEALNYIGQALAKLPGNVESSALLMRIRLEKGDVRGAEQALLDCLHKSPNSPQVALVLGRFYLVIHRLSQAEEQFRRATRLASQDPRAWLDLGMTLFHEGRQQEAGPIFARLSTLPDKLYKPAYGIFLLETGQRDAAIAEFEKLAREAPRDRAARTRLVKVYVMAGRRQDAEKLLAAALARNAMDADALLQRAELYIDDRRYQDAQNDLNLVLHYRPESAEPHVILARLDALRGQALNQRQELSQALSLSPGLLGVRLELAGLLMASNGAQSALETLDQAPAGQKHAVPFIIQRNWALLALDRREDARQGVAEGLALSRAPDLLLQDGDLKAARKDYSGAQAAFEEVLKQQPDELRAIRGLVEISQLRKQPAAGLHWAEEYAAAHPKSAPVQEFLGDLLLQESKPAQARAAFMAAKAADPGFRPADLALAKLDISQGNLEAAHRTLSALLAAHPNDPELWLYMGWLANSEKNYPQALEYFRKVVDAQPRNVVALNNLAYLLASQSNQYDEALKYAQQVKELAPDNPGVDDTIGWIMYRKGLYSSAVKYLEDAAHHESDPVIRYHLAMAYLKMGDKRGEPTLRQALRQAPNLPEARMAQQLLASR